jgi:hypothetical protein
MSPMKKNPRFRPSEQDSGEKRTAQNACLLAPGLD